MANGLLSTGTMANDFAKHQNDDMWGGKQKTNDAKHKNNANEEAKQKNDAK